MFDLKRIWLSVFGFVFLALSVVPAVAQADVPAVCLIGDHPGIPESDAQTAALLVCDELRRQGISVSDPVYEAPASANAYRLVLRRLGEKIIVRLSHENPIGTIITERQLTLANIEEMIPAAPRLVDALVHNKPIDDTVDMETITEQEARELRKISGESLWHVGIFGTFVPGTDVAAEPGFEYGCLIRHQPMRWERSSGLVDAMRLGGPWEPGFRIVNPMGFPSSLGQSVDSTSSINGIFHPMWAVDSPSLTLAMR